MVAEECIFTAEDSTSLERCSDSRTRYSARIQQHYLNGWGWVQVPTFNKYLIIESSMDFLANIIGSVVGSTGNQVIQSTLDQIHESGDEMSVDQAIAIGLTKNYGELFPETSEFTDGLSAFANDYETLRYAGFSSEIAYDIVQFIYFPRTYFIQNDHLSQEFVMDLNQSRVNIIVEDSLKNFIRSKGVSVDSDLEFDIAAIEGDEHLLDCL